MPRSKQHDNLVRSGLLKEEAPAKTEIAGLIESGRERLADAANANLRLSSRFDLAYGAAHALATVALRLRGYRAEKRYIVFQLLSETLGLKPEEWRILSDAHDRRNRFEYEGSTEIEEALVAAIIRIAREMAARSRGSSCRGIERPGPMTRSGRTLCGPTRPRPRENGPAQPVPTGRSGCPRHTRGALPPRGDSTRSRRC